MMLTAIVGIRNYARFASAKIFWYTALILIAYSLTSTTNNAVAGSDSTTIELKTDVKRGKRSVDASQHSDQHHVHRYNGKQSQQQAHASISALAPIPSELDSYPNDFSSIDFNSYDAKPEEVFTGNQDGEVGQLFVIKQSSGNDETEETEGNDITEELSSKSDLSNLNLATETEKRAPGWGKRAPGWGKRAPGWGKRAPGWGKRAPVLRKREFEITTPELGDLEFQRRAPGWGKRAPGWGKRAPGWGKRAPGWGKRAPGWGKRDHFSLGLN
ncbi:Hypothetical predicted protein [Octopus vulgaris]|uniref:Uncharacterized protein n=2 Tax=Octopus TaxID=6643 RepID=A0AA36BEM5_OCTVU|nr:uncharacterized protein LOC115219332 [Octopus sinensis]CAI9733021.1 Hypothetical predicted protein [Octopus vulgaris]